MFDLTSIMDIVVVSFGPTSVFLNAMMVFLAFCSSLLGGYFTFLVAQEREEKYVPLEKEWVWIEDSKLEQKVIHLEKKVLELQVLVDLMLKAQKVKNNTQSLANELDELDEHEEYMFV